MANDPNNVQGPPPVGPNFQNPNLDLRLMKELLQAPTDGVGDAIVVPPILANQFELKISLLNLVTAIAFHGFENDLLNKCPHHGFSPLHQIDTFYNSLNQSDQDSLNSVAGVSSASGSSTQDAAITALTKQVEALVSSMNRLINSIQNGCETCGGPHAYYECQAADGYTQEDVYATTGTYNAGGNSYQPQDLMSQMQKVLHERPQGALPSNTEPNPREQVNSITTRSGLTTAEPSIPPPVLPTPRVEVEKEPETLMDEVHITSLASTAHVPPPGIQLVSPPKPKEDPTPKPHQPKIPYPSRLNKTKLLDKNDVQVSKFLKILKQLRFDISLMDA
ncbi:hypothetical protein Tco_1563110 [Tanacetum coccineum]